MDEDEVEMMEETEITDSPKDKDNTEGDKETEEETVKDDPYRCKHYRRKCQFVVSFNWFVYNVNMTSKYVLDWIVNQIRLIKLNFICECCRILCCVIRKRSILDLF